MVFHDFWFFSEIKISVEREVISADEDPFTACLCYIPRYTDVWNRHRESEIHDIHEIGSGTQLYYLWVKGFLTWGARDTIFLCWLLLHHQLSTQLTRGARSAQIRLASPSSESRLSRSEAGTQLTAFSQIPKILSPRFRCMMSFTPPGPISYLGFYFDICEWRILPARAWTPVLMFAPN